MSVAPRVEELAELAISACAEGFGVPLPGVADGGWVDADAETSEPLYTPSLLAPPSAASSAPLAAEAAQDEQREQRMATLDAVERPDGHVVIDRLVERLKAEGLGKQAAQLVVTHNGYGSTPEESRELYGKLRSLLLERAVVTP